jgi:hypothetical protein
VRVHLRCRDGRTGIGRHIRGLSPSLLRRVSGWGIGSIDTRGGLVRLWRCVDGSWLVPRLSRRSMRAAELQLQVVHGSIGRSAAQQETWFVDAT